MKSGDVIIYRKLPNYRIGVLLVVGDNKSMVINAKHTSVVDKVDNSEIIPISKLDEINLK